MREGRLRGRSSRPPAPKAPVREIKRLQELERAHALLQEGVEFALLGYIDWFNARRIHHQIGGVPPAEFEATYYNEYNELCQLQLDGAH